MSDRSPQSPASPASRTAVDRTLEAARLAVIKARACWAEWAAAQCRAADARGGIGDALWRQLQGVDEAMSRAEGELGEALAQLGRLTVTEGSNDDA